MALYVKPVSTQKLNVLHKLFSHIDQSNIDSSAITKQKWLSFNRSHNKFANAFDLICMDMEGPLGLTLVHGQKYFLVAVGDHSRFTWLFMMKCK